MINYSTLTSNLKRGILRFSEKISSGLTRPEFKLISQMMYGILTAQSSQLSSIARALDEKISLKKIIDRLSSNVSKFSGEVKLFENYVKQTKSKIKNNSILVIDGGDLVKPCSTKMESLCRVRDGSTGEYGNGYHMLEATALGANNKMPIPVYTKIYSSEDKGFVSEDNEVLECLKSLSRNFKKSNIRALDRGYDVNMYYEYFLDRDEKFVIRVKKNRDVLYNGEKINIYDLAKKFKGKYSLKFQNKNGLKVECKITMITVSLPCAPQKELELVIVYGFGKIPMMLFTNLKSNDEKLPVIIAKVYLMRWRIEEYYKFKKQQFRFEDIRVRSLKSIKNMNLFITIAIGYLGIMSEKQEERRVVLQLIQVSKRIYETPRFVYYALADGLRYIFNRCKQGIGHMLKKVPKSAQICLFQQSEFNVA